MDQVQPNIAFIVNSRYPFGQPKYASIQQIQEFTSQERKREKKVQMFKKAEIVTNPSIIRLTGISEEIRQLTYHYERVPYNIELYLRTKREEQSGDIWDMTKKLLIKKLAYELTMLISYLGKMRIEAELSCYTIGMAEDEKVRLYVSPKSKMGVKGQIQLIVGYNQAKEKIMKDVQGMLSEMEEGYGSFMPRQKKQYLKKTSYQEPLSRPLEEKELKMAFKPIEPKNQGGQLFKNRFKSIPKLDMGGSRLRQTRTFQESNEYRKRKMSTGGFGAEQFDSLKFQDRPTEQKQKKQHKYSFQHCGTQPGDGQESEGQKEQGYYFGKGRNNGRKNSRKQQSQQGQGPEGISYAQSKSIRIELEQTQNKNEKKERKDSYKVKITTFREYEVPGNPGDLFGVDPNANQEDIFDFFANKANQEEKADRQQEQGDEVFYEKGEDVYDRLRKQTGQTNLSYPKHVEPPSPLSAYSMAEKKNAKVQSKGSLEQRIRDAKQKTNKALNLIKALRK